MRRIARSISEPSGHVVHAKQLLAVSIGASYAKAAQGTRHEYGDAVGQLVVRFNREELKALEPKRQWRSVSIRKDTGEIIGLLEATVMGWNQEPTAFEWDGKKAARCERSRAVPPSMARRIGSSR